jgi:hypothetical protein
VVKVRRARAVVALRFARDLAAVVRVPVVAWLEVGDLVVADATVGV